MKSSSSAHGRAEVAVHGCVFDVWTPEAVLPPAARLRPERFQEAVDEAVADALAAAGADALEREEAVLRAHDQERERLVGEAFEKGFEEGRCTGEIAEAARLRAALNAAETALDELRAGELRWSGAIEENVCALAVSIARQIIGRELSAGAEPVAELVRAALVEFPIDQPIRIRVNPADLSALQSVGTGEGGTAAIADGREARWRPDASIAPGGCVVEGRERIVDGRVDTALERVYRRLTYTSA
jgi:flagellar assembly protein FliH